VETNGINWFEIGGDLNGRNKWMETWLAIPKIKANDVNEFFDIDIIKWKIKSIVKNLISRSLYGGLMILVGYIGIDIYQNMISHSWYGRLMITICHIGINIYVNLISHSWYVRLMILMGYIGIIIYLNLISHF
jgi:hypothetical protein